jgi:class 3 adenylate cyclase
MDENANEPALERARASIAAGAWAEAYELLSTADAAGELDADTLAVLAEAAYVAGRPDVSIDTWERIHLAAARTGDAIAAANSAVRVSLLLLDARMTTQIRGWTRRAERYLEGLPEGPIHGGLAVIEAFRALWSGELEVALAASQRAVELGVRFDDPMVVAFGRLGEARTLILRGEIDEGMPLLDEAGLAAVSGELEPFFAAALYCSVVCALQGLTDYERAEDWTDAMERWRLRHGVGSAHGVCRVHRAEILRLRGAWADAEEEARIASEEARVYLRGEVGWPLAELGQIRLRRGDVAGAERAFLESHELGWDPQPGLAQVLLSRGDVPGAAASIRESLEHPSDIPSAELPPRTELRRVPLLAAQVEIALAGGEVERAGDAAGELEAIAAAFGTTALRAMASMAAGSVMLAQGDLDRARAKLKESVALWGVLNAPYEVARARMVLAEVYRAAGNREHLFLELNAARTAFERLGARLDARRAGRVAEASGLSAEPTGTKVFMFTDIVSSTPLVEAIGDEAWADVIQWHDQALRQLFAAHQGQEVDHAGDGFFVVFDDAGVALHCAEAIQRGLAEHRKNHGFAPQVRIGMHAAKAHQAAGTYRGKGVHQAARISALAEGGEIVASRETLEAAGYPVLDAETRTVQLRGISGPVEVVTVDWR